ncbi:MAG: hypothetical protein WCS65_14275 [Verrucomicrobiae bacterium]
MKLLARFQKAAALPFVLLLVALNVIVVVALLIYATTELQASRNSGQTEVARSLAQSGIDIAAGLIAANSTNNGFVSYQRVTNVGGDPRLETKIANVSPPDPTKPWARSAVSPAVLHSGFLSGTGGVDLNFAVKGDTTAGFIAPRTNISTNWTNLSTNMFRMDWIYVYKGPTNDSKNLVGRVAYWADEESSKLNINYSGNALAYSFYNTYYASNQDAGKWTDFEIKRPNLTNMPTEKNFQGRKWPYFAELGGVAGLTMNDAFTIITNRGAPKAANFVPYPSLLAVRIATNTVVSTLARQSELGFTATVYSKEAERSYATGRKRHDLLNVYLGAPETSTISGFQTEIVANYPKFDDKYDLQGFASAAYSLVQFPGFSKTNTTPQAGANYGTAKLYARGLPLANEISVLVSVHNDGGTTNVADIRSDIELVILGQSTVAANILEPNSWAYPITNKSAYVADITFLPTNTSFGSPITSISVNGAASTNWFKPNRTTNSDYSPLNPFDTNSTNQAASTFANSIASMSSTTTLTNTNPLQWVFPTNVAVSIRHRTLPYQTINFIVAPPTNAIPAPSLGTTNIVYHLVAQPDGDANSYRGDPRFGVFTSSAVSDPINNTTNSQCSIGSLNTSNWNTDTYGAAPNQPDITPTSIFFGLDGGIPQYVNDKSRGFGPSLAGVGWLGEVPVTTKSAPALAWSTPRLWGNGRPSVNGTDYPPDWLLLDCFHMAVWPAEAESIGSTNMISSSYAMININTAKSFFQVGAGSTNKSDTILDSITLGANSKDFTGQNLDGTPSYGWSFYYRTNFLAVVKQMVSDRSSTNNPYTTHYEFLAELATNNMTTTDPWHPWTGWWPSPQANAGSIYKATNTTDRRIEGIVRSLVHKLTTHGNQFTIYSLGQALQVVNGKTNVVGEAYLQSVYERAPQYDETSGAITNGSASGAPPMRQLYLRELRY